MTQVAYLPRAERPSVSSPTTQWETVEPLNASAPWMRSALNAVDQVRELPPGWDGGSSPSINAAILETARRLIARAAQVEEAPEPHVAPVPGGGLQLEWHIGGRDLELEVLPNGDLAYSMEESGNEVENELLRLARIDSVERLVRWLVR